MNGHDLYYVEKYEIVGPYTLDDGIEQVIDFKPILWGKLFEPLRDLAFFNQVRLDPEIRNLVWPNDAAFDPETLRNWPDYKDAWIKRAKQWHQVPV